MPESEGWSLVLCTGVARSALHPSVFGAGKSIGSSQVPAKLHKYIGDSTQPWWNLISFK